MDHSDNRTASTKPLEALEYPYQVFLISLYSFTACFAFISNLLTIVVMVVGKRCTRDLRKFLVNLSVTDLLMAVFTIPFTYTNYMLGRWIFFSFMCPIVNCAQLTTITVSIYTLVAIAVDRYVAIMHPLQKSISWFKRHRTIIVILIWIIGILLGVSQLIVSETNTFIHDGQRYVSCGERWTPESTEGRLYTAFIFSATFAMPMCALCIIYTAMGCRLIRYRSPNDCYDNNNNNSKSLKFSFAPNSGGNTITITTVPNHNHNAKFSNQDRQNNIPFNETNDISEKNKHEIILLTNNNNNNNNSDDNERIKPAFPLITENFSGTKKTTGTDWRNSTIQIIDIEEQTENVPEIVCEANILTLNHQEDCTTSSLTKVDVIDSNHSTHSICYKSIHLTNNNSKNNNNNTNNNNNNNNQSNNFVRNKLANCKNISNNNQHHQGHNNKNDCSKNCDTFDDSLGNRLPQILISQRSCTNLMIIRRNKVLKMLITIIGVFTVCWLPIQIFTILIYFKPNFLQVDSEFKYYAFVGGYFFCHWISMAHSFMNPIIYSFMSKNFRSDMKTIFANVWHYCCNMAAGDRKDSSINRSPYYSSHYHYHHKNLAQESLKGRTMKDDSLRNV